MKAFFYPMGDFVQAVVYTRHEGCPHGVRITLAYRKLNDGSWARIRERYDIFKSRSTAINGFNADAELAKDPEMLVTERPDNMQVAYCVTLALHNVDRAVYNASLCD